MTKVQGVGIIISVWLLFASACGAALRIDAWLNPPKPVYVRATPQAPHWDKPIHAPNGIQHPINFHVHWFGVGADRFRGWTNACIDGTETPECHTEKPR